MYWFTINFVYYIENLPSIYRVRWVTLYESLSLKVVTSDYMEFYSPVQVLHPVNKALKSQDNPELTRVLAQRLLQSSQNCHVCHRKKHLITHLLHFGIVWRVFIPFTRILVSSYYPKLPLNRPVASNAIT